MTRCEECGAEFASDRVVQGHRIAKVSAGVYVARCKTDQEMAFSFWQDVSGIWREQMTAKEAQKAGGFGVRRGVPIASD